MAQGTQQTVSVTSFGPTPAVQHIRMPEIIQFEIKRVVNEKAEDDITSMIVIDCVHVCLRSQYITQ